MADPKKHPRCPWGRGVRVLRVGFTFVDSSSGREDRGDLVVTERVFTAPTFDYFFEGDRALTNERLRTGRPLLEVRVPS